MAAAKVQRLHQLIKYDIVPEGEPISSCQLCITAPMSEDLELIADITINETQTLLDSAETLKQKVIYIAGYLSHKHSPMEQENETDEEYVTSEFLEQLNRGGLRVPTVNMVFLVHTAIHLHEKIDKSRRSSTKYFQSILAFVDSPFSSETDICRRLTNTIFKANV